MSHANNDAGEKPHAKPAEDTHAHTSALHQDAYHPAHLNEFKFSPTGAIDKSTCMTGPKLADLTIDVSKVHEKETPRNGDSYADRKAAANRDLPVSSEHFRELVAKAASMERDGNFGLYMKTALSEAFQSGGGKVRPNGEFAPKNAKFEPTPENKIDYRTVDNTLKYMNEQLCGSNFTMGRDGHIVKVYEANGRNKPEVAKYNLETKAWDK